MIFAFYSIVIEKNSDKFDSRELKKCDGETDSNDELERAFFGSKRKFRRKYTEEEAAVADRKSGIAVFSA